MRGNKFQTYAATLILLAGACALGRGAAAGELSLDAGDFEIKGAESKILVDRKEPREIRVCVTKGPDAVALAVHYDKKTETIKPGKCVVVEGKFVKIEAAGELKEDEWLFGKYEPTKR